MGVARFDILTRLPRAKQLSNSLRGRRIVIDLFWRRLRSCPPLTSELLNVAPEGELPHLEFILLGVRIEVWVITDP